jgi:phosphoribosylamine---glycine ligase
MQGAVDVLKELGITSEMTVASAHRSPERVQRLIAEAGPRGVGVFIVGAGAAAHLAGVVAAHVTKPVIGVPIDSSALNGLDALLSTVQMPPGVPVATVSIGKAGATNAGVLAAQILALADKGIADRLEKYKADLAAKVEKAARDMKGS